MLAQRPTCGAFRTGSFWAESGWTTFEQPVMESRARPGLDRAECRAPDDLVFKMG